MFDDAPVATSEDSDEVRSLADRLEAEGDPRGPLLALELAAAQAQSSDEARRLNRAAQARREAHPELAWPPVLGQTTTSLHAGLIVDADYAQLRAAGVPFEQLVSLRRLLVPGGEIDDVLERLAVLRARGLAPDTLNESPAQTPAMGDGRGVRAFASGEHSTPRSLHLTSRIADDHALASWADLRELVNGSLAYEDERLDALAPLGLVKLPSVSADQVPRVAAYFGDTLLSLDVPSPQDDLAGFGAILELPKLRSLSVNASRGLTRGARDRGSWALSPKLHSVTFGGMTVAESAEFGHEFPDLCFNSSRYWPHVAAPMTAR